jgi:hypothetical protein
MDGKIVKRSKIRIAGPNITAAALEFSQLQSSFNGF